MKKIITDSTLITPLLSRGIEEVLVRESLEKKLKSGKRLNIKYGIDPSGDELHLGHAVVLRKLQKFLELGHRVILLVGSFTGMVGDPSGRSATREQLSEKQVKKNCAQYKKQAARLLDMKKTKVVYNHTWLKKLKFKNILDITGAFTVSQMLERDMYQSRMSKSLPISLTEFFYPLMQGYDSVAIEADVELGGSDQLFNLLAGRVLQKQFNMEEQDILTTSLLTGLDGKNKMSKSKNNYISLTDHADDMYGKIMSIPDTLITQYFILATEVDMKEIDEIKANIKNKKVNPRDAKMRLAREIVTLYHSAKLAEVAEKEFVNTFQKKGAPAHTPTVLLKGPELSASIAERSFGLSKSEVRRLIKQKGIKQNGVPISEQTKAEAGTTIQKGKRHFVRVVEK